MIGVPVRDENRSDLGGGEDRLKVGLVVGAGIDHRAVVEDPGVGALQRHISGIVGPDQA
jgi:hypothetical protein